MFVPPFLCFACLDNEIKSILCCFDPVFVDIVVNVLGETSKNERTEDNFRKCG